MKKVLKNIGFLTLALIGFFFFTHTTKADSTDKLSGYALNSTIGQIIFNCTTNNSCASSNYGVTIDNSGDLSGFAWNTNVGWISFNASDVAGCPSAPCQPNVNLSSDDGSVTGFARIISMGAGQGYIELSSGSTGLFPTGNPAGTQGVSYNFPLHRLVGYAWSADYGWIQFSPAGYAPIRVDVQEPTIDFSINDWAYDNNMDIHGIPHGTPRVTQSAGVNTTVPVVIKWDAQDAQSCTAASTNNDPVWTGPIGLSGTVTLTITPVVNNQYTIVCIPTYGGVQVVHSLKVAAIGFGQAQVPEQFFRKLDDNKTFTLNFIIPSTINTDSCTVSTEYGPSGTYAGPYASFSPIPAFAGGPGTLPNGVSVNYDPTGHAGSIVFQIPNPGVISLTNSYWVVLRCMNGTTAVQRVYEYRPIGSGGSVVDLSSNPITSPGGPIQPNDSVDITYRAAYLLTSCTLHSNPSDPLWNNYAPTLNTAPTYSFSVSPPTQTTTYYMDCLDMFGIPTFDSVTVYVDSIVPPPPIVTLTAIPNTVPENTGTDLYYTSSNTASCTTAPSSTPLANGATGWDGTALSANGTIVPELPPGNDVPVMMATTTTTFYIQCTGLDGSTVNAQATVTVLPTAALPPTAHLTYTGPAVSAGATVTLEYGSAYTSSCIVADGSVFDAYVTSGTNPTGWDNTPPFTAQAGGPVEVSYTSSSITMGTSNTTFYMQCRGLDGSDIYVNATVPIISTAPQRPSAIISVPSCQTVGPLTVTTNITDPDNQLVSCVNSGTNPGPWDISSLYNTNNTIPLPLVGTPAQVILRCVTDDFGTIVIGSSNLSYNYNDLAGACIPEPGDLIPGPIDFQEH